MADPLKNKTFQAVDSFFGFIFKIGEIIFDYIVILFEVFGQIGNLGIKAFFKYIIGFFTAILKFFEKTVVTILKKIYKPFKGLFVFLWNLFYKIYRAFIEILQPFLEQFDNVTQYVIGFFIFVTCSVYYFLYRKNEDDAATAGKNAESINILEGLTLSSVLGKIYNTVWWFFKIIPILIYCVLIGLFSIEPRKTINEIFVDNKIELQPQQNVFTTLIVIIIVIIPLFIINCLYKFGSSFLKIFHAKLSNYSGPIIDDTLVSTKTKDAILGVILKYVTPIIEFIKYYYDLVYRHFNSIWDMSWVSFIYLIVSGILYVGFLYKLYFWGSDDLTKIAGDNHLYYYFVTSYLFFILPTVYTLLKLPQQSYQGLVIMAFSFISMLVMYVSNYYMNYRKSVSMDETAEQQSDRNTYNMLFVIYSAVIVFFVNFKLLRPNFDQSTILLYTLLNLCFIAALIGYSISYKIKLTNRLNKAAQPPATPPPNAENGVLTPDMTAYGGER